MKINHFYIVEESVMYHAKQSTYNSNKLFIQLTPPNPVVNPVVSRTVEDSYFTYDLEAMKIAMESPRIKVPSLALSTDEAFEAWLNS